MERGIRKFETEVVIVILLSLLNFYFWQAIFQYPWQSGLLTITFLDVGQGDAVLIDDSYGNQILVDGGDGKRILSELKKNLPFFDREIEMIVLTHSDRGHLGGLIKVLEHYEVDNVLLMGIGEKKSRTYHNLLTLVQREKPKIVFAHLGQKICLKNQACLFVLYPFKDIHRTAVKKTNNYCIVSRLDLGKFSLLLTSNTDRKLENKLLASNIPLKATILKIAHYGSKHSSQASFLTRVNPILAIISVGKNNRYGYPAPETLRRLRAIKVLRTDLNGDIKIKTDGKVMGIATERH